MATTRIGSLLDLLPRPNTPEWLALPAHVLDEVKLLRKGYRPISQGELDEHNMVPKRVEHLRQELGVLGGKIADVHTGQSELGGKLIPMVENVLAELRAMGSRVTVLEADRNKHNSRLDAHDIKHAEHDVKHAQHVDHITAVIKRIATVEQIVKRPAPRKKSRKSIKKGTRK